MRAERKPEFKTRLASVLWDAVEECVQRLDAEGVSEKARQLFICLVAGLPDARVYEKSPVTEGSTGEEPEV